MKTYDVINKTIEDIFGFIQIDPEWEIVEKEENNFEILISGEDLNFLIGYRGQSLDAFQSMLSLITFKKVEKPVLISVDINNYRKSRIEKIQDMTKSIIDKVRFFNKEVEMSPMKPWERRQVHMFVSEYDDIETESKGEGKDRRVVLKLKK